MVPETLISLPTLYLILVAVTAVSRVDLAPTSWFVVLQCGSDGKHFFTAVYERRLQILPHSAPDGWVWQVYWEVIGHSFNCHAGNLMSSRGAER